MKRIAIITFYYGQFNNMMDFWFHSVSKNPTIDFFMFTDLPIHNKPQNLKVINISFSKLISYTQEKFDFKICVPEPYKYPDFRPAFGEIFSEYLTNYDFWGFCDTDLILGDIRAFMTDELLDQYDKFLALGHFTLYRNTVEVNSTYKKCKEPNYKQVFTFGRNSAFEEYFGTSRYWDKYLPERFYQAIPFDDLDCYKYAFTPLFKKNIGKHFIYSYENGKLFRIYELNNKIGKQEIMYVHFQKRQMKIETSVHEKFMMVPNSFINYISNLNSNNLKHFDVSHRFYPHTLKLQLNRIYNKIKKIHTALHPSEFGVPILPKDGADYYKKK